MNYGVLVTAALEDLNSAAEKMVAQTTPATPMPRPRIFIINVSGQYPLVVPVPEWLEPEIAIAALGR